MKKIFLFQIGMLMVMSIINTAQATTAIHFAKNQTRTTILGTLSPEQNDKVYSFSAKKGQYMTVELFPKKGTAEFANVGEVITPSGKMQGDKGGIIYQDCLPETGKYRLRIARNLMATQGKTAGYRAIVTILPIAQSKQCQR